MRIISQSGNTDLNYDNCVLIVDDNVIKAQVNENIYTLAIYSSKEKIEKVMNRFYQACLRINFDNKPWLSPGSYAFIDLKDEECAFFKFPTDKDIEEYI